MRRRIAGRMTRKNAARFARVWAVGYAVQGAVYGLLVLAGVGSLAALLAAKGVSNGLFVAQMVRAAR